MAVAREEQNIRCAFVVQFNGAPRQSDSSAVHSQRHAARLVKGINQWPRYFAGF
jgi:hypothetical protein